MFIAVDLKVIEGLAGAVARAGAISEDGALAGLVRLWHRCWADEADVLNRTEVLGLFSFNVSDVLGGQRVLEALICYGFLEEQSPSFRVRGAARYLRLKESRRRGAQATNEKRKIARSKSDAPARSRATLSDAQSRSSTESPSHRVTEEKQIPSVAPKKPVRPVDPRYLPMVGRLTETFKKLRGVAYEFSGADGNALKALLPFGTDDEIDRRWRLGLQASQYETKAATLSQLRHRWNELAAARSSTQPLFTRDAAVEPDRPSGLVDLSQYMPKDP